MKSVLILKPSSLGDIVHTLPAVSRSRAVWPDARFSWLINTEWAPLLADNPDVNEIILFPRREFRGLAGMRRFCAWVRAQMIGRRPDLAIDFQGLLRTALIGRLSGAKILLGSSDAREGASWLYHRTVPVPGGVPHAVERYLQLAAAALGLPASLSSEALRFPLPAGTPPAGGEALERGFILLHPFSRGAGKSLTDAQVRAICARLHPQPVVLAGRTETGKFAPLDGVFDFLNRTTIPELIWLIRRAGFVISVDSGPMHLAAALGAPLVSIHTWSDPRRVGPYRPDAWVWKNGRLLQVAELAAAGPEFFAAKDSTFAEPDILAICALASR